MTRLSRSRSVVRSWSGVAQATRYRVNYGVPSTVTYSRTCTCSDYHGRPVSPSPLNISNADSVMRINGHMDYGYAWSTVGNGVTYTNRPLAFWDGIKLNTDPLSAPDGWYLDLVARTNPSRPVLCPPSLIQDLLDLPKMLRNLKQLMRTPQAVATPKGVANAYLETMFGWMPFVEDIKILLDLQRHVIKRSHELSRLYSNSGLRRKVQLGESHEVEPGSYTLGSYGTSSMVIPVSVSVDKKMWATIRWKPTTPPPFHPDDIRMNQLANRIVLGMTTEGLAKGLWDVIPWTWIVNWFTNVGKYTLAYSNTVPASHSEACLMSSSTVTCVAGPLKPTNIRYSTVSCTGKSSSKRLTRIVSGALTPGFNVPFMDTFRLSILSALTIQRVKR